jgi:hypothetical protein
MVWIEVWTMTNAMLTSVGKREKKALKAAMLPAEALSPTINLLRSASGVFTAKSLPHSSSYFPAQK